MVAPQVFGFDFMVDASFRVWLIEVIRICLPMLIRVRGNIWPYMPIYGHIHPKVCILGVWTCILSVWTCIFGGLVFSGLVSLVSGLVFFVSGLVFVCILVGCHYGALGDPEQGRS